MIIKNNSNNKLTKSSNKIDYDEHFLKYNNRTL